MAVTDKQVRKLMEEMTTSGNVGLSALRSGMDRHTAAKYLGLGQLPSELTKPRTYRTREDAFEKVFRELVEPMLTFAPELEAKAVFEWLSEQRIGQYAEGQMRTFQRRVREWRALRGPDREVFFPQEHRAGEAMQTDFTWANELAITIGGAAFPHKLCHMVLPYSNWEWATVCRSESMAALKRGVQAAVFRLGRTPIWHQTDNSTAATHDLCPGAAGERAFNAEYSALMRHLGMKARTTGIGEKEQNGDVEAANGALKARLKQYLLLRGGSDFESIVAYEAWVQASLERANVRRQVRLAEELAVMAVVQVKALAEYSEEDVSVTRWSTIRVKLNVYSVPSRLIGETVRVRLYDDRLEVFFQGVAQLTVERLLGRSGHRVNYRHIIWSLVRKPGAFRLYRYRDDLFPTVVFRRAYDALIESALCGRSADMEYLRILHLAASTLECDVEAALQLLLDAGARPDSDAVKALVQSALPVEVPNMAVLVVDLAEYDALLDGHVERVAA